MDHAQALREFSDSVVGLEFAGINVHRVSLTLDERQDGEPVTRAVLLVDDPKGGEPTWDFDSVMALRRFLAERAAQLDLPPLTVSLVPESEASAIESFVR